MIQLAVSGQRVFGCKSAPAQDLLRVIRAMWVARAKINTTAHNLLRWVNGEFHSRGKITAYSQSDDDKLL